VFGKPANVSNKVQVLSAFGFGHELGRGAFINAGFGVVTFDFPLKCILILQ